GMGAPGGDSSLLRLEAWPMRATVRVFLPLASVLFVALALLEFPVSPLLAGPKPESYWQVDDVHAGMKGVGRTVIHGVKVEEFQAEGVGVLKNTSPGRDMILCRLSGLDPGKTGGSAGTSGSPGLTSYK